MKLSVWFMTAIWPTQTQWPQRHNRETSAMKQITKVMNALTNVRLFHSPVLRMTNATKIEISRNKKSKITMEKCGRRCRWTTYNQFNSVRLPSECGCYTCAVVWTLSLRKAHHERVRWKTNKKTYFTNVLNLWMYVPFVRARPSQPRSISFPLPGSR